MQSCMLLLYSWRCCTCNLPADMTFQGFYCLQAALCRPPPPLCLFCRDPDIDRLNSGALASPSAPSSSPGAGPFDLEHMSMQANAELQTQEEERNQLRLERIHRANRAAAAARAAIKVRSCGKGKVGCATRGSWLPITPPRIQNDRAERQS